MRRSDNVGFLAAGLFALCVHGVTRGAERAPSTLRTEHFRVRHTLGAAAATELGDLLEALLPRFMAASRAAGFAPRPPEGPLAWLWGRDTGVFGFSRRDLSGNAALNEASFYSSRADAVVVLRRPESGPGGGDAASGVQSELWCISHELAHQLAYGTGLQARGVMYAFWASEGLAMNFETEALDAGCFAGPNAARGARLAEAYRGGRLCPLADFVVVTAAVGEERRCNDLYAQAWGLVQFLYTRDPAAFRRYLATVAMRPAGKRPAAALRMEFVTHFGAPEELEPEWTDFLVSQARAGQLIARTLVCCAPGAIPQHKCTG